jgi:hypothetical protein
LAAGSYLHVANQLMIANIGLQARLLFAALLFDGDAPDVRTSLMTSNVTTAVDMPTQSRFMQPC